MHDHYAHFSHDVINRCLSDEKLTSQLIFENVFSQIYLSQNGYVIFDESVLDKNFSVQVELLRRQYSSNVHAIIKGSGLIDCLYINPESGDYWIINYRIFDLDGDGTTKLDYVQDMLIHAIAEKKLSFTTVLMGTWCAIKDLMLFIESVDKIYYGSLHNNRLVGDSGAAATYQHVSALHWTQQEQSQCKTIKIKGFPRQRKVKLFWVVVSTNRTDWVVTNDLAQTSTDVTEQACRTRWKIEQFHRELK